VTPSAAPLAPDALNARFGLGTELAFRAGPGPLVYADVANDQAHATLCLQGAQLLCWQPRAAASPVIWLSAAAQAAAGRPLRGGVPVCWPWFGPHAGGALPSHGFARNLDWQVLSSGRAGGATFLVMGLQDSERTRAVWPHAFALQLRVEVGAELGFELASTNRGRDDFLVGEALHSYFRIGDIGAVRVEGLETCAYVDSAAAGRRDRQQGAIGFDGEFDRVYLGVPGMARIVDPGLGRRIDVHQTGARSTVVWNPWAEKAARLADLGPGDRGQGGWREMLCVESGNALDDVVLVPAGTTHRMTARIVVAALPDDPPRAGR